MYCEPLSGHAVTSGIDHEVLAIDEAEPPQLVEQREMMRRVAWTGVQAADAINPPGFLRVRCQRPCRRRAAEQRDERATLHSITSSARASSVGGTSRPSALAVLRLRPVSYLVGACTGRSAGFSPLRIRPCRRLQLTPLRLGITAPTLLRKKAAGWTALWALALAFPRASPASA